ncbi:hypothetical protein [Labrys neptuniae]
MMTSSIKRRIRIANESNKVIEVIIEPHCHEKILNPKEGVYIDIEMWEDRDTRDNIVIKYYDNAIVLFEDGDIDMEFYEGTKEN